MDPSNINLHLPPATSAPIEPPKFAKTPSPAAERKSCIKEIWDSALIHWSLASIVGGACLWLSVVSISIAAYPISIMYGVAALVSYVYSRHQRKGSSVKFWAEKSQLFTNYFKYKHKNLTLKQASTYEMGSVRCYYHPIYKSNNTLFQGAQPSHTYDHFTKLRDLHNIKVIINLTEEAEEAKTLFSKPVTRDQWEEAGVKVYHFPVEDFKTSTLKELRVIVPLMKHLLSTADGNVYIHCMSGMGRSSVPTLGLFIYMGDTLGRAKEKLLARRCQVNIDKKKMNCLLWEYTQENRRPSYTLSDEIKKRLSELDPSLTLKKKKKIILKEYSGIEGLNNVVSKLQ